MTTLDFFSQFWEKVTGTPYWITMIGTVENSPWHREANVAVHTTMTIEQYMSQFYDQRTEKQRALSLMALLFHDFGKPEAEETLEKKEEPGVFYRRYAGHEMVSANEFMSFMCDYDELREMFFAQGFDWEDIRKIKVMIEHHLPYGLKNEQKRKNLKQMLEMTLGEDEVCFYDMLRSDSAGRISDDHETKLKNVEDWINEFQQVKYSKSKSNDAGTLLMLVGISGAGKSTLIKKLQETDEKVIVFSEDALRIEYGLEHCADVNDVNSPNHKDKLSEQELYNVLWEYCHLNKESKYEQYANDKWNEALRSGYNIVLDRMNHSRKGRSKYIQGARAKGYRVESLEFYMSENKANERQATRSDKKLSPHRVHQLIMQLETPWLGVEVDSFDYIFVK